MIAKAVGIGVTLAAAWAAQQVIAGAWKVALGHKPPKPEDEGDARFAEIAVAAVITGAVVALARVLATRGAAKLLN
ncbi:MAG: DUF4235 domain-containing protein [Cellulomonadaceae bacterium]|nr:DUF4235 domain-containing protein [Cellulomonadaceae bacterium]